MKSKKYEINFKKGGNLLSESVNQTSELANLFNANLFNGFSDKTKYCKEEIYSRLFCDTEALQLIIFQAEGFNEVIIRSLQVNIGRFLLVVGCFRLFLARCRRQVQVVSCSLQIVFRILQVVSGLFLLVVDRCRLFQVFPCFSKYEFWNARSKKATLINFLRSKSVTLTK